MALLDIPGSYGQPALDMLEFCGVDWENFPENTGPGIPRELGLRAMLLFPAKDWGRDHVVPNRVAPEPWPTFLERTPYNSAAREAIIRIQTDDVTDPIVERHGPKSDQEKKAILSRLSYRRWLIEYMGANEQAMIQYQRLGHGLLGAGAQAVSAGDMWALGNPGFDGLGLNFDIFPGIGRTPQFALAPPPRKAPAPRGRTATPRWCACSSASSSPAASATSRALRPRWRPSSRRRPTTRSSTGRATRSASASTASCSASSPASAASTPRSTTCSTARPAASRPATS